MSTKAKVLVIGAGPAGMMAAGTAAKNGCEVTIVEKNKKIGRKLIITGKGRCNITNDCNAKDFIDSIPSNGKFLYSAINKFSPRDTMDFFESLGLKVKVERGNRVFPESDRAADVVAAMGKFISMGNCRLVHGNAVSLIIKENRVCGVKLESGEELLANSVIIACGGKSYPLTGSTGDGYVLASQAGHTMTDIKPSLVPLVSNARWCKDLQGLSLRNIAISVKDNKTGKTIFEDFGELLFTHFGLSGPVILSASSHMRKMENERYSVSIDLKPALSMEKLDLRIQRDLLKYQNKDFINSLSDLLPRKLIPVVVKLLKVDSKTKCNQFTKEMRRSLCELLKNFVVPISGFRPIDEAIVTSGGVKTSEINPKTMQSKLIEGLYFAGEVIDVDGYTGGFNLQIAFSTGYIAGSAVGGNI